MLVTSSMVESLRIIYPHVTLHSIDPDQSFLYVLTDTKYEEIKVLIRFNRMYAHGSIGIVVRGIS
jgi:hypothetical protein